MFGLKDNPELTRLLEEGVARFRAMSPEAQEAMLKKQREGIALAEASWPKSKYHWEIINGERTKVYESMEDYYND